MSSENEPRGRASHLFHFQAIDIANACRNHAGYHRERLGYWEGELDTSVAEVKKTAKLEVKEFEITGGKRLDLSIDYGDGAAHRRMQEAQQKIQTHRNEAERFEREANVYTTQSNRVYELTPQDIHYFRLGGEQGEE